MGATGIRPDLHVEGEDDVHSLVQLLVRHGVSFDPEQLRNATKKPPVLVPAKGGVKSLINGIVIAIQGAANETVGFVLDADAPILNRWEQIRHRLIEAGVEAPVGGPPAEGFIGVSTKFKTRVGVWLMPDNEHDGKLEDLLTTLIDEGDPLIKHAQDSTDQAKTLGAAFSKPDVIKAVIHCWLAWQKEPGRPYGVAIKSRYFQENSPTAKRFVAWFKELYGLD